MASDVRAKTVVNRASKVKGTERVRDWDVLAGDGTAATQSLIDAGESPECPDCGSMTLYYSEGCKTCESCGWSEC
ncbi:hypothetical protein GRX66_04400 [Halobacterium sp. PCN9]|uniref:Uncharacterized protein n=2 Tax=Halobacterium bonnevillei TaxID=2692200 RepID=A0A6B0SDR3_9EURY|nr:hypothetical protein [Halobacterium bonnevillei]